MVSYGLKGKERHTSFYRAVMVSAVVVMVGMGSRNAFAELVFENQARGSSAESVQKTPESYSAVDATSVPAPVPVYVSPQDRGDSILNDSEGRKDPSRADLLRRKRIREEVQNEDKLQARLEELRLKEEQERAVLVDNLESSKHTETKVAVMLPGTTTGAPIYPDGAPVGSYVAQHSSNRNNYSGSIGVSPRLGMAGLTGVQRYDVNVNFATGIGVDVTLDEHFSMEVGWTFSQYGLNLNSADPFVRYLNAYNTYSNKNFETLRFNQNIFDLGFKAHLLDTYSTFRPFIGMGGAFAKGFVNYNKKILRQLERDDYYRLSGGTQDYELSQWLGYVQAGIDIQVNDSIAVGAVFKFYKVLTSDEKGKINNYAFCNGGCYGNGPNYMYPSPYSYYDPYQGSSGTQFDKEMASGSLADANFWQALMTVTFRLL